MLKNSARFTNMLTDTEHSLLTFLLDLKLMDGWTIEDSAVADVKALVRNRLNRPKLFNTCEDISPDTKGSKYLEKVLQKVNDLDEVRRSWLPLAFAELSVSAMHVYDAFYRCQKGFERVEPFVHLILLSAKTDALFESYFWTVAFLNAQSVGKAADAMRFMPAHFAEPFHCFFNAFQGFLNELDPEIDAGIKACVVGIL